MALGHLVEELDDVGEVHVPVEDYVAVALHQPQGDEQEELGRGHLGGIKYNVFLFKLSVWEKASGLETEKA